MNKLLSTATSSMLSTEIEIRMLEKQLPHDGYINTKIIRRNRKFSGSLIRSPCMDRSLKATPEKAKLMFRTSFENIGGLTSMARHTISKSSD